MAKRTEHAGNSPTHALANMKVRVSGRLGGVSVLVRGAFWLCLFALATILTGCGTNLDELLYQSGAAVGRTALDLFLTDLANGLAEALERENDAPPSDVDGDGGDDDEPGPPDDTSFDELTGDPIVGDALFTTNNCAICHCVGVDGACATPLLDVSAETLDETLRGDAPHAIKVDLSDQQIVDLEAFLGGL